MLAGQHNERRGSGGSDLRSRGAGGRDHRRVVGNRRVDGAGARARRRGRLARSTPRGPDRGARREDRRAGWNRGRDPDRRRLGGLDILVNNAGVMLLGPVIGANTDEWRRMVDVNVLGLLYCTHAALPIMGEQGSGHIVNVSSVAGRFANFGSAVYNLTKFGVNAFSEALRQELAPANVRVTVVEPGMVSTELLGHNTHPMVLEAAKRMQEEIGEPLTSEDIAEAILYAVA